MSLFETLEPSNHDCNQLLAMADAELWTTNRTMTPFEQLRMGIDAGCMTRDDFAAYLIADTKPLLAEPFDAEIISLCGARQARLDIEAGHLAVAGF